MICTSFGIISAIGVLCLIMLVRGRQQRNYPQPSVGDWIPWFGFAFIVVVSTALAWLSKHPLQIAMVTIWALLWTCVTINTFITTKTIGTASGRYGTVLHTGAIRQGGGLATPIYLFVYGAIMLTCIL